MPSIHHKNLPAAVGFADFHEFVRDLFVFAGSNNGDSKLLMTRIATQIRVTDGSGVVKSAGRTLPLNTENERQRNYWVENAIHRHEPDF